MADERAAGPNPEVLKDPAKPVNERSLERGDGGGPGEKSQPERAEREATLRRPEVEKRDKPAPRPAPTEREKAPKPVIAPVAEPELEPVAPIATVAPVPTVLPDAAANGKAIAAPRGVGPAGAGAGPIVSAVPDLRPMRDEDALVAHELSIAAFEDLSRRLHEPPRPPGDPAAATCACGASWPPIPAAAG